MLTTHVHLAQRLVSGAIPVRSTTPSWLGQRQLRSYIPIIRHVSKIVPGNVCGDTSWDCCNLWQDKYMSLWCVQTQVCVYLSYSCHCLHCCVGLSVQPVWSEAVGSVCCNSCFTAVCPTPQRDSNKQYECARDITPLRIFSLLFCVDVGSVAPVWTRLCCVISSLKVDSQDLYSTPPVRCSAACVRLLFAPNNAALPRVTTLHAVPENKRAIEQVIVSSVSPSSATMVSMFTTCFNIKKHFVLPAVRIDLFCVIQTQSVLYGGKAK